MSVLAALLAAAVVAAPTGGGPVERTLLGRSTEGRAIQLYRFGDRAARTSVLVVGCIHGDECAGTAVTRRLLNAAAAPAGVQLFVVQNLNPDGFVRDVRQNARGVDLNRNWGSEWRPLGPPWTPQHAGARAWSERETRLARALILRVEPDVTIWFHQPQALIRAWGRSIPTARRYARLAGMPYRSLRWPHGTAPNWQNHRGTTSFVVELPPGPMSAGAVERHTSAVLRLAQ